MNWTDWLFHNEMMQPQHPFILMTLDAMRVYLRREANSTIPETD